MPKHDRIKRCMVCGYKTLAKEVCPKAKFSHQSSLYTLECEYCLRGICDNMRSDR